MFPNKPMGATHFFIHDGQTTPGGAWVYYVNFFKFVEGEWMRYVTDTDNEYPGWSSAPMHYRNGCFDKVKEKMQEITAEENKCKR